MSRARAARRLAVVATDGLVQRAAGTPVDPAERLQELRVVFVAHGDRAVGTLEEVKQVGVGLGWLIFMHAFLMETQVITTSIIYCVNKLQTIFLI